MRETMPCSRVASGGEGRGQDDVPRRKICGAPLLYYAPPSRADGVRRRDASELRRRAAAADTRALEADTRAVDFRIYDAMLERAARW